MALKSDSSGFLVGEPTDALSLIDEFRKRDARLEAVQRSVANIERMMKAFSRQGASIRSTEQKASRAVDERPAVTPVMPRREESESKARAVVPIREEGRTPVRAERKISGVRSAEIAPEKSATVDVEVRDPVAGAGKAAATESEKAQPREGKASADADQQRDEKGRFVGKGGTAQDAEDLHRQNLIMRSLSALADAQTKAGDELGETDPTVLAMQEATEPFARTFDFVKNAVGDDKEEGWLRRIFKSLTDFKKQESTFNKAQDRRLKAIEDKPVAVNGESSGGFMGLLSSGASVVTGGIARILPAIAALSKRIPLIGTAFAGLSAAWDIFRTESDDNLERGEKDKRTGTALGGFAGTAGGAFAGAKAGALLGSMVGPIGTAVGAAVGGAAGMFFGDKAGEIVGSKVGEWVAELREFDLAGTVSGAFQGAADKITSAWDKTVDGFKTVKDKMAEKLGLAKDAVTEGFSSAKNTVVTFFSNMFGGSDDDAGKGDAGAGSTEMPTEKPRIDPNGNPFDPKEDVDSWRNFELSRRAYEKEGLAPEDARRRAKIDVLDTQINGEDFSARFEEKHAALGAEDRAKIENDVRIAEQTAGLTGGDRLRNLERNPYKMYAQAEDWEAYEMRRAAYETRGMSPHEAAVKARENPEGMKSAADFDTTFSDLSQFDRDRIRNQVRLKREELSRWKLGQTSEKFESGGRGAGTVSSGKGDHGGASYGTYQLSSKAGTLGKFLRESGYGEQFKGLRPGTDAFNKKWKEIAANDPEFGNAQHDFIRRTHYDPAMQGLREAGIDLSNRGNGVKDAIWSTSVQFGAGSQKSKAGAIGMVKEALKGQDVSKLSDAEIIERIQDYKIANNDRLFRSSDASTRVATFKRARAEKQALLAVNSRYQSQQAESMKDAQANFTPEERHAMLSNPETSVVKPEPTAPQKLADAKVEPKAAEPQTIQGAEVAKVEPPRSLLASPKAKESVVKPVNSLTALSGAATAVVATPPAPQAVSAAPRQPAPPAESPAVSVPLSTGEKQRPTVVTVENDVGQDLKERGIAHIATGGIA